MKTPATLLLFTTIIAYFGFVSSIRAVDSPPGLIDYQGQLLADDGVTPITNGTARNYEIRFRIWRTQSGTVANELVWAEKQIVTVTGDGFFSVRLGEGDEITVTDADPLPLTGSITNAPAALLTAFDGNERFLGVTVMPDSGTPGEIQPRLKFLTSPFAVVAQTAIVAQSGPSGGDFTANQIGIGIGATSPLTPLQVDGSVIVGNAFAPGAITTGNILNIITGANADGSSNGISFHESNGTGQAMKLGYDGVGLSAANALRIYDRADNPVISFHHGGNVGIGTTSPSAKLHVNDAVACKFLVSNSANGAAMDLESNLNGGILNGYDTAGANLLKIRSYSNNGIQAYFNAGNVGIGTTSPDEKLHVEGTIEVDQKIQANDSGGLELATDEGTTRLKIADSGNVGIGTSSPTENLHVTGNVLADFGAATGSVFLATRSGISPAIVIVDKDTANGGPDERWDIYTDERNVFLAEYNYLNIMNNNSGNGVALLAGDTSWSSSSDRNKKKNFEDLDSESILEKLVSIPVQRWNYKTESDDAVPHIGPVAQDFKGAFFPGRDNTKISTLEFDGVALAAIQGLNKKVEHQNASLAAKDTKISDLESRLARLEAMMTKMAEGTPPAAE